MTRVVKDGVYMAARDKNQLAAFLNNGWKRVSENTENVAETENTPIETKRAYTKTDINRMSTAELQTLASDNGIEGADGMTGAELKKLLIEHFGL